MADTMMRTREASEARWLKAAARAIEENVQVRQIASLGAWIPTSGADATVAYETSMLDCDCLAGLNGDPVCKHRAALRMALGVLRFDPEPPTPAAPALAIVAPVVRCAVCRDSGRVTKPSVWFAGQTMEGFCPNCAPHYDFATRRFIKPAA